MPPVLRLPFTCDVERLHADLALIQPDEWQPHYNTRCFQGEWSGVAFRGPGGRADWLFPDTTGRLAWEDTELLDRCGYVREILNGFACPLQGVRFLKLGPGAAILEHTDQDLEFDAGEVRIHVPVTTSPDVDFYLDGERREMAEGEFWYTNVELKHHVTNRSAGDRVHLIIDCVVNDWLRALFERAQRGRA